MSLLLMLPLPSEYFIESNDVEYAQHYVGWLGEEEEEEEVGESVLTTLKEDSHVDSGGYTYREVNLEVKINDKHVVEVCVSL